MLRGGIGAEAVLERLGGAGGGPGGAVRGP